MPRINLAKALVVILGVETSFRQMDDLAPADDATRAAMAHPRRGHGVLTVEAAPLTGQKTLPVAEHRAVLLVAEGAALQDLPVNLTRLNRQGAQGNNRQSGAWGNR